MRQQLSVLFFLKYESRSLEQKEEVLLERGVFFLSRFEPGQKNTPLSSYFFSFHISIFSTPIIAAYELYTFWYFNIKIMKI